MNILGLAFRDSLVAQTVKSLPEIQEIWDRSVGQEGLLDYEIATLSSILTWKIHGQWNLVSYSLWDRREWDTTK